jgi:HEAT repeat protein
MNSKKTAFSKITVVGIFSIILSLCPCHPVHLQADEVTVLIERLYQEDLIVRLSAAKALGEIKDARAVEPLVAILRDESSGSTAANALAKIGKPAVKPLVNSLREKKALVRRNAATALGKIKDASAVEPLIAALKDEDPLVRMNAASALGNMKSANAAEFLITALKDKSTLVRRNAATALGEMKNAHAVEPLMAALKDRDALVRSNAAAALGGMDIFCLLPVGCHLDHNVIVLIRELNDEDPMVRLSASKALGDIRDASAVEPLIATLGDRNCGNMAANALANIGKPSVEPLCEALKDGSVIARRNAATALGKIKDSSAAEPLIAVLKDEDLIVRRNAATALGQIQDPRAVESLITALRDKSPIVRRNAAIALGQIKDANAVEPLISALKDRDAIVRTKATTALGEIGKPAVEALIVNILY